MYEDLVTDLKNSYLKLKECKMVKPTIIADAENQIFQDIEKLEKIYNQYVKDITGIGKGE